MLENNIRRWNQWLVLIINWHHWFWWFISFWRSSRCILCLLFRKGIAIRRIEIIATMSVIIKPPIKNNNKTCVDMKTALMQRFSLHNVRSYQIIYVNKWEANFKSSNKNNSFGIKNWEIFISQYDIFIRNINLDLMIQEIRFHRILFVRLLSIFLIANYIP